MRTPKGGNTSSGAADRMVMYSGVSPLSGNALFGKMKLPVYVASGSSVMTSPGCAAFNAA